jgi:hypothetical protein
MSDALQNWALDVVFGFGLTGRALRRLVVYASSCCTDGCDPWNPASR